MLLAVQPALGSMLPMAQSLLHHVRCCLQTAGEHHGSARILQQRRRLRLQLQLPKTLPRMAGAIQAAVALSTNHVLHLVLRNNLGN